LFGTALLALLVTWPTSWLAAVTALLIGVPLLYALLYLIQPVVRRAPPILQFVVLIGAYVPTTWVLSVTVQWLTAFIARSAAA
jgi:xanthosine utilization system XapX-like protein